MPFKEKAPSPLAMLRRAKYARLALETLDEVDAVCLGVKWDAIDIRVHMPNESGAVKANTEELFPSALGAMDGFLARINLSIDAPARLGFSSSEGENESFFKTMLLHEIGHAAICQMAWAMSEAKGREEEWRLNPFGLAHFFTKNRRVKEAAISLRENGKRILITSGSDFVLADSFQPSMGRAELIGRIYKEMFADAFCGRVLKKINAERLEALGMQRAKAAGGPVELAYLNRSEAMLKRIEMDLWEHAREGGERLLDFFATCSEDAVMETVFQLRARPPKNGEDFDFMKGVIPHCRAFAIPQRVSLARRRELAKAARDLNQGKEGKVPTNKA